jgi:hypothetical protein
VTIRWESHSFYSNSPLLVLQSFSSCFSCDFPSFTLLIIEIGVRTQDTMSPATTRSSTDYLDPEHEQERKEWLAWKEQQKHAELACCDMRAGISVEY